MSAWSINPPSSGTLAFSLRLAPYCRSCPCDRHDLYLPSFKFGYVFQNTGRAGPALCAFGTEAAGLGAAAPVTGADADEHNLSVVDCDASVTVPRLSSIPVLKWESGGYPHAGGKLWTLDLVGSSWLRGQT